MEEKKEWGKKITFAVEVDGQAVPTWEAQESLFHQMMAQSCRIDRSNTIAWAALGVAVVDFALLLLILL